MSKIFKALVAPIALSVVGFTAGIAPAMAAGGIRAAYVEEVIPSRTYSAGDIAVTRLSVLPSPANGVLGLTTVTLTNPYSGMGVVLLFSVKTAGPNCTGSITNALQVLQRFFVQPTSTLHLTFPTPTPVAAYDSSGTTCIGIVTTANSPPVDVYITGVVN